MVSPEDKLCATLATFVCLVPEGVTARDGEAGRCVDQGGNGEGGVPQRGEEGWDPPGASGACLIILSLSKLLESKGASVR